MTHRVVAVLVDEFVYGYIIGVELRTCVIPPNNVLSS